MRCFVVLATLLVLLATAFTQSEAQEGFKYSDREVIADLAAQILRITRVPAFALPHKRNSELINSLLGLPKVMNDAGRR
ncbi:pigment-dispersing factor [Oratosquilla oratoria]|uniref:pigment-dispersing factor n=1 Tax=Oratosquilla oratoria TaxID=337810 RepID=UPI003F75DE1F